MPCMDCHLVEAGSTILPSVVSNRAGGSPAFVIHASRYSSCRPPSGDLTSSHSSRSASTSRPPVISIDSMPEFSSSAFPWMAQNT